MRGLNLSIDQLTLHKEASNQELARRNLLYFTKYTKEDYEVNWHHKVLADHLDRLIDGDITRLMVFMPPRHGKSELTSRRLPAFFLGKYPELNLILTSYSGDLANDMNKDVQDIIDSEEYLKLFPNTRLDGSELEPPLKKTDRWVRTAKKFKIVENKGGLLTAGVGGSITGKGANLFIIDDPIKNIEEALSDTYREKTWRWYTSTAKSRLEKNAKILLIMTRWHEDDLAARILQKQESDPNADQWTVLSFPAVCETTDDPLDKRKVGEVLWTNKKDEKALKAIEADNKQDWLSLYQQRPSAEEGNIFKRKNLRNFYLKLPQFEFVVQSWDLALEDNEDSDYVVGQVWGVKYPDVYLIDEFREIIDFTGSLKAIRKMSTKYPEARKKIIEKKANGHAAINVLKKELRGIDPYEPKGDSKTKRAKAVSYWFEAENIFLPHPSIAPWVEDYINEMANFPRGKFDDRVDATTQVLIKLDEKGRSATSVMVR